jgi:hypothetical protein
VTEPPMSPAEFAELVGSVSPEDLARGLEVNREQLLGELFRAMPAMVDPEGARRLSAVIEWRITGGESGVDRWQLSIGGGSARVERDGTAEPNLTIELDPVTFVRMAAGLERPPVLWLRGRLKLDGDLFLAARLPRVLRSA